MKVEESHGGVDLRFSSSESYYRNRPHPESILVFLACGSVLVSFVLLW